MKLLDRFNGKFDVSMSLCYDGVVSAPNSPRVAQYGTGMLDPNSNHLFSQL